MFCSSPLAPAERLRIRPRSARSSSRGLGGPVARRELWRDAPPILTPEIVGALFTPAEARTAEQRERIALSDELLAELRAADTVVIAAGMINFGMPAALKAWIDQIARKGETFTLHRRPGPRGC